MKLLKQAMAVLGTVVVVAMIAALVTPKTAHALVATAVQVVNTASQPVPTQPVHARQAVYLTCSPFENSNFVGLCTLNDRTTNSPYTVPAGKRLVFDSVTGSLAVSTGQGRPYFMALYPNAAGQSIGNDRFVLIPTFTGTFFTDDIYSFGQNATIYSDPGSQIIYEVDLNASSDSFSSRVEVFGHTEDIQ